MSAWLEAVPPLLFIGVLLWMQRDNRRQHQQLLAWMELCLAQKQFLEFVSRRGIGFQVGNGSDVEQLEAHLRTLVEKHRACGLEIAVQVERREP